MTGVAIKPHFTLKTVHRDKDGNVKSVEESEMSTEIAVGMGLVTQTQLDEMKARAQKEKRG